jgi:mono/diheme cytochrome c family protein
MLPRLLPRPGLVFVLALVLGMALLVGASALADDAMAGKSLYAEHCQKCHGESGHSDTAVGRAMKAPMLADMHWSAEQAKQMVHTIIRENPKHKALSSKLSDEELDLLAGFLRTLESGKT